jgi:hypothetical protein
MMIDTIFLKTEATAECLYGAMRGPESNVRRLLLGLEVLGRTIGVLIRRA